ncbi:MAG TPA: hypothetical protein VKM54_02530 [Myxococcota bacterium]|nr:hypothetical protein [Myxococcota bacterium]
MRPDQFALLLILLSTPQPHARPALFGTWQSQDPVATTGALATSSGGSSLVQETAVAPARVRLTFSPGTCHTHHPTMDATYPCSIKPSDRSSFVVEHFDPERHRRVRRVFVVDGNRMWTRAGDSGATEVFTRVH